MKKYKIDFIIIIIFVLAAVISLALFNNISDGKGAYVEVVVDKEIKEKFPLNEYKEFTISDGDHINKIKIQNGKVWVSDASCPDKLCVKQGDIDKDGQSIICLPNRVVVKIVSDNENEVDAVAN